MASPDVSQSLPAKLSTKLSNRPQEFHRQTAPKLVDIEPCRCPRPRCNLEYERCPSRTVTLRPNRFNLWSTSILLLVVAGGELGGAAYPVVVLQRELGVAWFLGASALFWIALVVGAHKAYIQVDDSAIIFGPQLLRRRSFDRREVARIRASHSPLTRRTLFLRSDGSTMYSTPGVMWGRDGLQRLADFLGVPLQW